MAAPRASILISSLGSAAGPAEGSCATAAQTRRPEKQSPANFRQAVRLVKKGYLSDLNYNY